MDVQESPSPVHTGSLRDADWRLLLPEPGGGVFEHVVLLGAGAGAGDRLVSEGIARRVTTEAEGKIDPADAVVVLGGAPRRLSIEGAARLLTPGGSLYLEVDRRGRGPTHRPRRVRRALEASGLTPIGTYWVRPTFDRRQTYVPLDVAGPLEWFLDSAYSTPGLRGRLLGTAMRTVARVNRGAAGLLARRYAVTAVSGGARDIVMADLSRRGVPTLAGAYRIAAVLNTNGSDELNRVIILPFEAGAETPAAVLKGSRLASRNHFADDEQAALSRMRTELDASMRETLPSPLGLTYWGSLAFGAESYLHGRLLAQVCRRRSAPMGAKIAAFRQAVEWLTQFHRQAQVDRPAWSEAQLEEYVGPPVELYRATYGLTEGEEEVLQRLRECSRAIAGTRVPIIWQHYAYAPWNITRLGRQIRVFDWEGAGPNLPLYDLLYFAMRWYEDVTRPQGGEGETESFRRLFCAPDEAPLFARLVNGAIDEYLQRLGIAPPFRAIGLTAFAFARAVSRIRRVAGDEAARPTRVNERRPEIVQLLVDHRDRIFGGTAAGGRGDERPELAVR